MNTCNPYPVYCRSCKKQIGPDYEFCPYCGAAQSKPQSVPAQPMPPAQPATPPPQPPMPPQRVPQSFATVDYRYVPCPACGAPVMRPRSGALSPPKAACQTCGAQFLIDRRGGIPVICPACGSTYVTGGGFPLWALLLLPFSFIPIMLAEAQPTKYVCQSCDCHFIGTLGANMVFGFFVGS